MNKVSLEKVISKGNTIWLQSNSCSHDYSTFLHAQQSWQQQHLELIHISEFGQTKLQTNLKSQWENMGLVKCSPQNNGQVSSILLVYEDTSNSLHMSGQWWLAWTLIVQGMSQDLRGSSQKITWYMLMLEIEITEIEHVTGIVTHKPWLASYACNIQ